MKYAYEKKEPEELTVQFGEKVTILADDDGSGWSLVNIINKVSNKIEQGYVPTSYLCHFGSE